MCWVFSQTTSVTSHQFPEMLPGPFPAWFSCGWWLRGEEVGAPKPGSAMPCLHALAPWPWHHLPWSSHPGVWAPVGYSLLPCVWLMLCVFISLSQVRLGWLWQPSALTLWWVENPLTQSSLFPLTLCASTPSTALLPLCPQMILTFSETWLSMMPGHYFKMCMAALQKNVRERD